MQMLGLLACKLPEDMAVHPSVQSSKHRTHPGRNKTGYTSVFSTVKLSFKGKIHHFEEFTEENHSNESCRQAPERQNAAAEKNK